ncbi:hypothetical protein [Candidatus Solirubrobacter pratensis]|uniref:hypothetical protein n=1 Tax=Candidatus Solirubrobacter pratensis TaxID=1298857 RepID=UPI000416EBE0|nr:hypothetical protein [Candidatus Solirubrobacter pratensis]
MRLARLATPIAVLTLALAGCGGGSKVAVQEVPGGASDVTVKGGEALAPKPTATATPTVSATATPEADTTSGATTQQQQQTQQSTTPQNTTPTQQSTPQPSAGGGAAAPEATPAPGSDAQQFETFCQQNPGAC